MEEGEVVEGSEDELMKLGTALNFKSRGDSQELLTAGGVLEILRNCLCYLGANGNALIESPTLKDGSCARVIASKLGEVHIPRFNEKGQAQKEHHPGEQDCCTDIGKQEYEELRLSIRHGTRSLSSENQTGADMEALNIWTREMKGSAVAGFQLATRSGPICEEPVRNILVVLEGVEVAVKKQENDSYISGKSLASGKVVSALRSGIRCALLTRPARLMEGYLKLTLNSSLAGLGALYTVLSKRRGKVVDDSMVDGTDLLLIKALIPQAEAFGLTPELFAKTKGEVTAPEMIFSHWARLDVDPFWIPTTEEEREDFGELQTAGDSSTGMDNTALRYIRMVRERKGLMVDSSRTVVAAEKQRTLKR
jgi:ribosome assembly protein 1